MIHRSPNWESEISFQEVLPGFYVSEADISEVMLSEVRETIETANDERAIQKVLEKHPEILAQHLGGGHGRWVIPQMRLGAEYIPDFIIGERNSGGFFWHLVELESPRARLFIQNGDPSLELRHAIRQVHDWRAWLTQNQNYASRPISENGLGLVEIHNRTHGIILIGRRTEVRTDNNPRRRQMELDNHVTIMSYDRLLEWAQERCDHWTRWRESIQKLVRN